MPQVRSWLSRLIGLTQKKSRDAEMAEEIRQHVDGLTERNLAAGMSPEEARCAALRTFGGIEQIKEAARDQRVWLSAEQLWRDFRFALRALAKQPGFTVIATLTLALGIGANTAIFSIVNAVLLRPLPFPEPDRIVFLSEADKTNPNQPGIALSLPDYLDWRHDNTVFADLAASIRQSVSLSGISGRNPEQVGAAYVTSNFFKVIGVSPQLGRVLSEEEDRVGAPLLLVISDQLWEHVFNRNASVIGQAVTFNGSAASIIGVMPREMTWPQEAEVWVAVMRHSDNPAWRNRSIHPGLLAWGRLKSGVTLERARSEVTAIAARLEQAHPESNTDITVKLMPLMENLVGKYRVNLCFLLGAVALVLLIACANLANLFAARGTARAREFAIRAAVGAQRAQIIRQLLVESLVVATIGGLLGFVIAAWSRDFLGWLAPQELERFRDLRFDGRVLGFTFLLACLTSVFFGLWPAWQASHLNVQDTLKAGAHGSSDSLSARRTRDWLVVADVAFTLLLLSSAGLVLKSFARVQALNLGFEPRGLMTARFDLPRANYADYGKVTALANSLLDKLKATPGMEKAAVSANPPMLSDWRLSFVRSGIQAPSPGHEPSARSEVVAGDYLGALNASLLRGRALNERDTKSAPLAVMIDQTMAERYFPGEDPIGQQLSTDPDGSGSDNRWFEIVGVVSRVKFGNSIADENVPVIYFSLGQVERYNLVLLARTSLSPSSFENTARRIITAIDPRQPIYSVRSMSWRVAQTWATQRLLTFLLSAFAVLALLLASVGLYGVLSYTALRRLREIGLRLALGARPAQIRALIFRHGMRLLLVGAALGLLAAIASARLLRSVLFEVSPNDPSIYLLVSTILALATAIACWVPATRACRTDPMIVLRDS